MYQRIKNELLNRVKIKLKLLLPGIISNIFCTFASELEQYSNSEICFSALADFFSINLKARILYIWKLI